MPMVSFETTEISGFLSALYGMRHPLQSYEKMDSQEQEDGSITIGANDYGLAKRLINAGGYEHAKFLRQIQVWVNISAPRYFWSEWDTYSVGVSKNSQSTMHTITKTAISRENIIFPYGLDPDADATMDGVIEKLNLLNQRYAESEDADIRLNYFYAIKGLLPEGFIQTRMVNLNYQVLRNMYNQRKNHRLEGWNTDFVNWVHTLPMSEWITGEWPEENAAETENAVDGQ